MTRKEITDHIDGLLDSVAINQVAPQSHMSRDEACVLVRRLAKELLGKKFHEPTFFERRRFEKARRRIRRHAGLE